MSYDKHHTQLKASLTEFERLTGTGNVKMANLMMAKTIRSLVAMMETQPKGCGGNCQCGSKTPFVPREAVAKPATPIQAAPPATEIPPPALEALEPIADQSDAEPVIKIEKLEADRVHKIDLGSMPPEVAAVHLDQFLDQVKTEMDETPAETAEAEIAEPVDEAAAPKVRKKKPA